MQKWGYKDMPSILQSKKARECCHRAFHTPHSWCRAWQEKYVLGDEVEIEEEFCYD